MIRYVGQMFVLITMLVAGVATASQDPSSTPADSVRTSPAPTANVAPDYIIGPGDTLQVFVWRNPELSVTVPVRPDGKISTPLVEDMVAVGKTPSILARDIEGRLAEYVRTPTVNIIVSTAVSTSSQVRVVGQVKAPQSLPFREGMTILDAILAVGGPTEFAAVNRTKLVRRGAGDKVTEQKVKLGAVLDKGDMKRNVALRPGDVIVVPESWF